MSDTGRKGFSDKLNETVTPDSQKNTFDKAKEGVTDQADKLGSKAQPNSEKSYAQQASDKLNNSGSNSNNLSQTAGEYVESAKNYVNDALGGSKN